MFQRIVAMACGTVFCLIAVQATSAEQSRFYVYENISHGLQISNVVSGKVCANDDGPTNVCNNAHRILITGTHTCDWSADTRYPCSWYGYEYDYQGAAAGAEINCAVRRKGAGPEQTSAYTLKLTADRGHIFQPVFKTYAPVDSRVIISEVHHCSIAGEPLTSVEYLIYYQPGRGPESVPSNAGEPYLAEAPNACEYLTEPLAHNLLRWTRELKSVSSTEHLPPYRSQCAYSARYAGRRQVGFLFLFQPLKMYDVVRITRQVLEYTATVAASMDPLVDTLENLGNRSFVFDKDDRTTLLVIAGIRGPDLSDFQPTELIATYYLADPELNLDLRQAKLVEQAEAHLRRWQG